MNKAISLTTPLIGTLIANFIMLFIVNNYANLPVHEVL